MTLPESRSLRGRIYSSDSNTSEGAPVNRIRRRRFLKIALGLGALTVAGIYFGQSLFAPSQAKKQSEPAPAKQAEPTRQLQRVKPHELDDFTRNIMSGGPPKDGIPSIDNPRYVSAERADSFLGKDDVVFGLDYKGVVRAYPQIILVWHEIVNDVIAGEKVSITYCPLTGSAVGFKGRSLVDGKELTFGTSGKLVNSNLLMYDRQTDSNWPQILGTAINGPNKANRLEQIPLDWTTWEKWRSKNPNTDVLSTDTGHIRSYGSDPYGSYKQQRGYYVEDFVLFPVMAADTKFHPKKTVVGLKVRESIVAVPREEFATIGIDNFEVEGEPLLLLYDKELDVVRIYSRRIEGQTLDFIIDRDKLVDKQSSSEWTYTARAIRGKFAGTQLEPADYFDVMWFAWSAFYPNTKLHV